MISVVLATHNEEKNLAKCLEAVKDFADEIVIADGESSDATLEIAEKYKAKVIKTTNKRNFHINKQMAMDKAKGAVVLQLDADEIVDEELKRFIIKLDEEVTSNKDRVKQQPVAWNIKRRNFFLGRFLTKGGQYPDPAIRLYLAGKAWLPQKDVHEVMEVDGETATAEGHLLHYPNPTFTDYLRKFQTYTTFKAHQLQEANVPLTVATGLKHVIWMPLGTFLQLFVRHKGFVDGFPGLVFALFSGLHHAVAYLKYWELTQSPKA